MKLWKKGLIVIVAGIVINTLLMNLGVGGIIRDLVRLSVLVGLGMLLIGLVRRKK